MQTPAATPIAPVRSGRAARRAPLLAVFASIQGEGAYAGEPQAFVRLAGCPLRCRWCDTPASWRVSDEPERVTASEAAERVRRVEGAQARTVSITGGEPLLWPAFVRALAAELAPRRVHLETGGGHPAALAEVIDSVAHTSLDLKLPADLAPPEELPASDFAGEALPEPAPHGEAAWRAARRRALALVRGRNACGKLVLAGGRGPADVAPLLEDVRELAPGLLVVVQPVTPMNGVRAPSRGELEAVVDAVRGRGLALRVLPQVHRALHLP